MAAMLRLACLLHALASASALAVSNAVVEASPAADSFVVKLVAALDVAKLEGVRSSQPGPEDLRIR